MPLTQKSGHYGDFGNNLKNSVAPNNKLGRSAHFETPFFFCCPSPPLTPPSSLLSTTNTKPNLETKSNVKFLLPLFDNVVVDPENIMLQRLYQRHEKKTLFHFNTVKINFFYSEIGQQWVE